MDIINKAQVKEQDEGPSGHGWERGGNTNQSNWDPKLFPTTGWDSQLIVENNFNLFVGSAHGVPNRSQR